MNRLTFSKALGLAAAGLAALVPLFGAQADPGDAQRDVRNARNAGMVRSLRDIESHVLPTMAGMQYLGPEYDAAAMAYRLKFIHDGRVVFVDVDAKTGEIIRQSR